LQGDGQGSANRFMQESSFDVIVIGAGHAGIEACLASARLGRKTLCITMRLDRIGHLPCNCSIGGPAKGHIAREVDALGGQMGITADYAVTHIRKMGTGKGPSVQTLRAHVCKDLYPKLMRETLLNEPNLIVLQGLVETVLTEGNQVSGVRLEGGEEIKARSVVITTGTFLNGLCHEGTNQVRAARFGEKASVGLSQFLVDIGTRIKRFKTGTTPRVRYSSLNLDACQKMDSEPDAGAFSYLHSSLHNQRPLLPSWQTWTNLQTHNLIHERIHESAMYSGAIEGIGPRYCPSIEDKIVRFAQKERHPIFLEVETWDGEEVYVQGVSTSLPVGTQVDLLKTVPGMENVELIRPGYAVEYDMADPLQLTSHLMSKLMPGLFLAGQINGTSGYEEAAGQGIVAGINAARFAHEESPVDFPRSQSFIGVMIDDITTKGVDDPYRMLTARSEHRLVLRSDNADARLTPLSIEIGLCGEERKTKFELKQEAIKHDRDQLSRIELNGIDHQLLAEFGQVTVDRTTTLFDFLRRPGMDLNQAEQIASRLGFPLALSKDAKVREQVQLAGLYSGYLERQEKLVADSSKLDGMKIPAHFDYEAIRSLSHESREKLMARRPESVGQASRIPGVRMSDIYLLVGTVRENQRKSRTATLA